jgi:hypothetical protein
MAFLVLEWDDADVECLVGNLLTRQRHPRTAGHGQRDRLEVVGGPSAAAGDCCAWKAGEFGALNRQWPNFRLSAAFELLGRCLMLITLLSLRIAPIKA